MYNDSDETLEERVTTFLRGMKPSEDYVVRPEPPSSLANEEMEANLMFTLAGP
jgi:hypothetical protein